MPHRNLSPTSEIRLATGDVLYAEGDPVDGGYIIASGELLLHNTTDGTKSVLERRGPGSIVGELSILTGQPRTVTVEATQPCKVFKISAKQILHRYAKIDPILRACIETSITFATRLNSVAFDPEDAPLIANTLPNIDQLVDGLQFENDIMHGLATDQFSLVYQPIVRLSDGEMLGAEALMRWHHPTIGNIPPGRFIEVAEKMGAICLLTDFALVEACATLKRLRALGQCRDDFFVTINISNDDLKRPGFFDFLMHVLDLNDLDPFNIKLEVTETELVLNSQAVTENLEKLRGAGLGIAIDDFGTGYSNLAYLKEIPLTALKIDRAFAGDAVHNRISHSIVKMIINLGHELGVWVVAEGLETAEDVKTLRDLGCDLAQGYYFAKPMSEGALSDMIEPKQDANRNVA